jgi:hypothetical protein
LRLPLAKNGLIPDYCHPGDRPGLTVQDHRWQMVPEPVFLYY